MSKELSILKPDGVNDSQWKAVAHTGSHLLIVAGPGTGKTHTLIYRIYQQMQTLDKGCSVLAITFTNKAAREMQQRLEEKIRYSKEEAFVGTFHQFCLSFLREYAQRTDLPKGFIVANPDEIEIYSKDIWPDLSLSQRKDIIEAVSLWKASNRAVPQPPEAAAYAEFLRKNHWLDFDDLILGSIDLLTRDAQLRLSLQLRYQYIFVDEYQDINQAQNTLLKLLIGDKNEITAIGDPHQAIYGFRGADVRFFSQFTEDFPGAEVLNLSVNYRSTPNIVQASCQVIAGGEFKVPELTAHLYLDGKLVFRCEPTEKAEAEYVVHQIEKMVGGMSMFSQDSGRVASHVSASRSFSDIAVLYRLNSQRHCLEEAFDRIGIPYQVAGDRPYQVEQGLQRNVEKVNFLTIHAAKGLEFRVVFIVGCEEALMPLSLEGMEANMEEERRLFYVAMTRAKEELYFTRAKKRMLFGKYKQNAPSPFLNDIEEKLKTYEKTQGQDKKTAFRSREKQLSIFDK